MSIDSEVLKEIIKDSGLKYYENSQSLIFSCPRCLKSKKLYIRKRDGIYSCFYCSEVNGFKGSKVEYCLTELLNIPVKELKEKLYGGVGDTQEYIEFDLNFKEEIFIEEQLIPMLYDLDFYPIDHKYSQKGAAYLEGRGIPIDIAKVYDIHFCPPTQRVIFPVKRDDRIYGWQGRSIVGATPKILASTHMPKDRMLMFEDNLKEQDHIIICEGPIDALTAHLCGGAICTMGKNIPLKQLNVLKTLLKANNIKKVYIALDPDAPNEIMKLVRDLEGYELYNMVAPKPFKDLGEMTMDQVYDLYKSAKLIEINLFVDL